MGRQFSRNKEASTEVAELLNQFVGKQQSEKAKRPQKQAVEWLESMWNEEALSRNKWGNWVLECAKNPDDLRPRVKALKDERAAKQREREERKKREEEEAERQRLEAEARREARRKRAEERKKQEEEEAERQRLEAEARREARRKRAEERKKQEEEEAERQRLEAEERREARRKRAEERKKLQEEEQALLAQETEAEREARLQKEEAERRKREEEKAEKQRLAAEQAEARREAQRQKQEVLAAARKKREEERAERQRLAEEAAEERREARRQLLAAREAEQRRLEAEEAERVRQEELEEKRRELDRRWAENAVRRQQQAREHQKVVWSYVMGVGIAIGLLFGLWVISRGFDVSVAKTGLVWPWCWWHIKFIVGLGFVLNIILFILANETHPGTRDTISEERYKEIGSPQVGRFVVVSVVITLGMFIYALCHLFSVLGFSVRALGTGLLFVVEFPVVGMLGVLLTFLCNGLLWGHYE